MAGTSQNFILAITLVTLNLHPITSNSLTKAKSNARPVHEVINEQSRSDKQLKTTKAPGNLPYGNPLAGNANARLHAQNQQAMFNAEKMRQHKAQLQRWTKAPIQMDSYMKAYQESQENHQIALEQAQSNLRENSQLIDVTSVLPPKKRQAHFRQETKSDKGLQSPQITKITRDDAVTNTGYSRSHRSYGSDYSKYLADKKYHSVIVSPAPDYDQGVTIKPHGVVGVSQLQALDAEQSKLYTQVVPNNIHHVHPKEHSQIQNYQSAKNIDALSSLLKQTPQDQLSQLTALLQSSKGYSQETPKEIEIDTPIDLYFYQKDTPSLETLSQHYDQSNPAQLPQHYASAYMNEQTQKDHTPITEEVEDIPDPNQKYMVKPYGMPQQLQKNQIQYEEQPHSSANNNNHETTTIKSNNYYRVEVASQTISSGYKPTYSSKIRQPEHHFSSEESNTPSYQVIPTSFGPSAQHYHHSAETDTTQDDLKEVYLHHNSQHQGIQHLTEDGTGVSAYDEDSHNLHYAANYEFGYRVKDHHSGNDFGHREEKKGDKTKGAYHVLLPDGRLQKVLYSAGPEGYHADISYDHLKHFRH